MKIRDRSMPDETLWSTFFDPHAILSQPSLASKTPTYLLSLPE